MFYAVSLLGCLGVVPVIHSTYQVACDAADPLERNVAKGISQANVLWILLVHLDGQVVQCSMILLLQVINVVVRFYMILYTISCVANGKVCLNIVFLKVQKYSPKSSQLW